MIAVRGTDAVGHAVAVLEAVERGGRGEGATLRAFNETYLDVQTDRRRPAVVVAARVGAHPERRALTAILPEGADAAAVCARLNRVFRERAERAA